MDRIEFSLDGLHGVYFGMPGLIDEQLYCSARYCGGELAGMRPWYENRFHCPAGDVFWIV